MLVATAYTSLLFLVPASLLRNRLASFLFWVVTPVSFAVHAIGGKEWTIKNSRWGRTLVLADKALANAAGVATVASVIHCGQALSFTAFPFWVSLMYCVASYHMLYPAPPKCWVRHHTVFHMAVVHGTLWAAMCGA